MSNKVKYSLCLITLALTFMQCQDHSENVLFSSGRNGNSDIFIMDGNGDNIRQLTTSENEEWAPTWLNAGSISFLRQRGDVITRHILNINTMEETEVEHPENCVLDDKNMLYGPKEAKIHSCNGDIFYSSAQRNEPVNLTEYSPGKSLYPSWNSNGKEILFTNNENGNNDIYGIDVNTRKVRAYTNEPSNDERADLSPDRSKLIYSSDRFESGNQDIVLLDLKTGEVINISNSPGTELIARWNAAGDAIFFGSNKDGNWEIYKYDLSTKTETRLTNNESFDGDPRVLKF